eukprot:1732841-Prymnesium_polylepis.1
MGDASGLDACSNMLLYCAEHHTTLCSTGHLERAPQASARRQGQWIVKRTPFTRPVLARGGEQGQNVYLTVLSSTHTSCQRHRRAR